MVTMKPKSDRRRVTLFDVFLNVGWISMALCMLAIIAFGYSKGSSIMISQDLILKGVIESSESIDNIGCRIDCLTKDILRAHMRIDGLEHWARDHALTYPNASKPFSPLCDELPECNEP